MEKENSLEEESVGDQESILLKVAGLYASHLLSDIILVVGECRYPAHRVILSGTSSFIFILININVLCLCHSLFQLQAKFSNACFCRRK